MKIKTVVKRLEAKGIHPFNEDEWRVVYRVGNFEGRILKQGDEAIALATQKVADWNDRRDTWAHAGSHYYGKMSTFITALVEAKGLEDTDREIQIDSHPTPPGN